MRRLLDILFSFYFVIHIPACVLIDSQAILPRWLYPSQLVRLNEWYTTTFKDTMMIDPPMWFRSFCLCEVLFQFPYFFVAASAFWRGAAASKWIRIPNLVYSSHVATTVVAIVAHIMFEDFSGYKHPGPETPQERLTLIGIYLPFLVIPFLMLLDALLSDAYRQKTKSN
ncbi:hypothetical protein ScPMuIL_005281 [Solemya velum]